MIFINKKIIVSVWLGVLSIVASVYATNMYRVYADNNTMDRGQGYIGDNTFLGVNNSNGAVSGIVTIHIDDNNDIRVAMNGKTEYSIIPIKEHENSIIENENGELLINDIIETKKDIEEEYNIKAAIKAKTYSNTTTQGGLVDIANPDPNYNGKVVKLSPANKDLFQRLVFGEAGNQGFIGACLVAQCIRDMWISGGFSDANTLRKSCGYTGSINKGTNQDCIDAVNYIFDQGGYAVKHRILYFYSFANTKSRFHESQNFIIQYKGHRVFDRW